MDLRRANASPAPEDTGPIYDARMLVGNNATARILLDGKVYTCALPRPAS